MNQMVDNWEGSDDKSYDFTALFIYFCNSYSQKIDEDDSGWRSSMIVLIEKEEGRLKPYDKVVEWMIDSGNPKVKEIQRVFAQMIPRAVPGRTFAEMWKLPPGQKESNFYQLLWDISQLDGYDLTMFENEQFSGKELRDITNVITVRTGIM